MSLQQKQDSEAVEVIDPQREALAELPLEDSQASADCPRCFGTGMEVVPGVGARRCECKTPDPRQTVFQAARIPPRYQECRLDNYDAGDLEVKSNEKRVDVEGRESPALASTESGLSKWKAKIAAQKLINNFLDLDGRGLLLIGSVGVGKTHLAAAILNHLLDRYRVRGLFYQFGALLKEIQDSYNAISQTSELRVLEPVFRAEVLVLDELGSSKMTDWVRDTMMQIINTRYNEKQVTIFTSNYLDELRIEKQLSRLKARLDDLHRSPQKSEAAPRIELVEKEIRLLLSGETLEDRIGVPLRSRLYEMCETVLIEGDDYRKRSSAQSV